MKRPFEQIPFNPSKAPFFYGWAILFWGVLGIILSVPGQTTGVSAFIEPLIKDLGITRFQLSLAYMIGTLASSVLLTPAGKLFDRIGARWMGFSSCALLGVVLLLLSHTPQLAAPISRLIPNPAGLITLLSLLFCALRLSGQGVLTMASRNMIMKWFDHHRGLVSGISGAAVSFGFSYTPLAFSSLIATHGWSATWWMLGLALLLIFAPLLLIFFRDAPETSGLRPDGRPPVAAENAPAPRRQFSLAEARRSYPFWIFTITMALQALILTATTFHIESIFEHAGMNGADGFSIFPPAAYIAVVTTLLGGWLSDRVELRWLLLTMLATMGLSLVGYSLLAPGFPIGCIIVGGGIGSGLYGVLMSVTWPRFYGREHLGAISGLCMTFMVIFSAIGPAFYSAIAALAKSYYLGHISCLIFTIILFTGSFRARNPQP